MAKCTYKMPDDFLNKLSKLGNQMDETAEKVLEAGSEVVFQATKESLKSVLSGKSTGELVNSLGVSPMKVDKDGNPNVKIGFSEPRKDGTSNAMIANVIEYGKHNQPPRPFLKIAKTKSKKRCIEAMEDALNKELEKL